MRCSLAYIVRTSEQNRDEREDFKKEKNQQDNMEIKHQQKDARFCKHLFPKKKLLFFLFENKSTYWRLSEGSSVETRLRPDDWGIQLVSAGIRGAGCGSERWRLGSTGAVPVPL